MTSFIFISLVWYTWLQAWTEVLCAAEVCCWIGKLQHFQLRLFNISGRSMPVVVEAPAKDSSFRVRWSATREVLL